MSYDSEPVLDYVIGDLDIRAFRSFYEEHTGEALNETVLRKLELVKPHQGDLMPTHALVLFSEGAIRREYFPYAKIECARFKGTDTGTFIDQKTIDTHIGIQAEQAYEFVLRHINKSAVVEGVYTNTRWQYPVVAIREAIRNAVVHRDYALTGRDIKVAAGVTAGVTARVTARVGRTSLI